MNLFSPKIKVSEQELLQFLDSRIFELDAVANLVDKSHGDPYNWRHIQKRYLLVKQELENKSVSELYKELNSPQNFLGPFAGEQVQDMTYFLETGNRKFYSVLDLPSIWLEEKRRRQEEQRQREQQDKAERRAKALAEAEAQKKAKNIAIAENLGIKPETLERLQTQ